MANPGGDGGGEAWVTLATNDSYCLGALVLGTSLRRVATTRDLVVLVSPGVSPSMRSTLQSVFNVIQEVNILDSEDATNLAILNRPELGITFTKIHCWKLTQYSKCVFLDADTLVIQNCDELFERDEFSAAPDAGWPDCFNSGVFVYQPSLETFESLQKYALEHGSFDGGDQGLLNSYFSDWATSHIARHLPFVYNVVASAVYSYLPAFRAYAQNIKIAHFIGPNKPWLQFFDTVTGQVYPPSGQESLRELLQAWWDIFRSEVHRKLVPEMANEDSSATVMEQFPDLNTLVMDTLVPPTPIPQILTSTSPPLPDFIDLDNLKIAIRRYPPVWPSPPPPYNPPPPSPHVLQAIIAESRQRVSNLYPPTQPPIPASYHPTPVQQTPPVLQRPAPSAPPPPPYVSQDTGHHWVQEVQCQPKYQPQQHTEQWSPPKHEQPQPRYQVQQQQTEHWLPPKHEPPQPNLEPHPSHSYPEQMYETPGNVQITSNTSPQIPTSIPYAEQHEVQHKHDLDIGSLSLEGQEEFIADEDENVEIVTKGLAGAFAQISLEGVKSPQQLEQESLLRKHAWEQGHIDYMGKDSFDNILKKIQDSMAQARLETTKEKSPPKSIPVVAAEVPGDAPVVSEAQVVATVSQLSAIAPELASEGPVVDASVPLSETPLAVASSLSEAPVGTAGPLTEVPVVAAASPTETVADPSPPIEPIGVVSPPTQTAVGVAPATETVVADTSPTETVVASSPVTETVPALASQPPAVAIPEVTQEAPIGSTIPQDEPQTTALISDTARDTALPTVPALSQPEAAQAPVGVPVQAAPITTELTSVDTSLSSFGGGGKIPVDEPLITQTHAHEFCVCHPVEISSVDDTVADAIKSLEELEEEILAVERAAVEKKLAEQKIVAEQKLLEEKAAAAAAAALAKEEVALPLPVADLPAPAPPVADISAPAHVADTLIQAPSVEEEVVQKLVEQVAAVPPAPAPTTTEIPKPQDTSPTPAKPEPVETIAAAVSAKASDASEPTKEEESKAAAPATPAAASVKTAETPKPVQSTPPQAAAKPEKAGPEPSAVPAKPVQSTPAPSAVLAPKTGKKEEATVKPEKTAPEPPAVPAKPVASTPDPSAVIAPKAEKEEVTVKPEKAVPEPPAVPAKPVASKPAPAPKAEKKEEAGSSGKPEQPKAPPRKQAGKGKK